MTIEEALAVLDTALGQKHLTNLQELVFRQAWNGKTYAEIGESAGYDPDYVKDVGYQLWQLLSKEFGKKVSKNNLQPVIRQLQQTQRLAAPPDVIGTNIRGSTRTHGLKVVPDSVDSKGTMANKQQDWGEAVDTSIFCGRSPELVTLREWIVQDHCRLVAILGMAGVGKTTLSVKLAEQIQGEFEFLIWRSLRNAPSVQETLASLIKFLSNQQETHLPETTDDQISRLLEYLRTSRCLLILDNAESILQSGDYTGCYREGYEGYGQLLRCVAETAHQSCLLLTSREKPRGLDLKEGSTRPVRSLQLAGLPEAAAQELLKVEKLAGSAVEKAKLIQSYRGNPLALKIISYSIQALFDGNIAEFLEQGIAVFNGIRRLLDQQLDRRSSLEKQIMVWLAINREPVSVSELQDDIVPQVSRAKLLEVLESLLRRSLIEKSSAGFSQQPVVMEYVTEQFIEQVCQAIATEDIQWLTTYALIKAQARDYVRDSQIRLILSPIANKLRANFKTRESEFKLKQILTKLREEFSTLPGYGGGNIINLLRQLQIDFTGYDFSQLTVWQAYLADVKLQHVNFAHADLAKSVFAETFGGVSCVAFSPDDQLLATSDTSGEVQIWEVASSKQLQAFKADNVWTWSVAFSPDGRLLASVGDDYEVKLWDVKTGKCLQLLKGHTNTVNAIAFHPTGQLLASCAQDATIRLWQLSNVDPLQVLQGHRGRVWSLAFSPGEDTLVSSSEDQTLKLWDLNTGKCRQTLTGHTHWVKTVAVSPDGQIIASGSFDGMIKLWEMSTGQCLRTWQAHESTVTTIAFSPDGRLLASASYDQTVKVWDITSRQCLKLLKEHSNRVWSVAFNSNGQYLASGGDDHAARLWNLTTGQCVKTWKGHTNCILSLSLSENQQLLATGHEDQTVKLWHPQTGQVSRTLRGHTNRVWSVAFAPQQVQKKDGVSLASGSADRSIKLWNHTGQCLKTLYGHTSWVWSVAISPTGHQLASGSYDRTIKLWDVYSGECLNTLEDHTAPVVTVLFSPDGQWLASSSFDTTIKLWAVETGECLRTFQGHQNSVWAIAFSPDGKYLASCSYDQMMKLWDIYTGACLHTFKGHQGPVVSLAFNVSGQYLASGSFDRTVKLWNTKTGQCLRTFYGHTGLVSTLVFQSPAALDYPDQANITLALCESLLSGSFDETLRVWDTQTGECLQTLNTPCPYEGMNITGVTGLTVAQKATLKALGAVDEVSI